MATLGAWTPTGSLRTPNGPEIWSPGLSVPLIGAGIALDLGASAPNTVLGFAIVVGLGVVVSGWAMLGRRP
jgi:hypothetical protein